MRKIYRKLLCLFFASVLSASLTMSAAAYTKPAGAKVLVPTAAGTETASGGGVTIDSSNKSQGYVMIKYSGSNDKIKVQITNGTTYTYDLPGRGTYDTFPFSEGSGSYTIKVYEHVSGNQYSLAFSKSLSVSLDNDHVAFLYPNQYCNFSEGSSAVQVGAQVSAGATDQFDVVKKVFYYVIGAIGYDYAEAESVQSGYLPDVDAVLARGSGICFDYAAVMTAMLRGQDIPTKLVIGYTGSIYHAWVSVYLDTEGWVDAIYFDGRDWSLMDPTFASSNQNNPAIQDYIRNASNYQAKYCY